MLTHAPTETVVLKPAPTAQRTAAVRRCSTRRPMRLMPRSRVELVAGLLASAGAVVFVSAAIAELKPYVPVLSLGVLYVFAVLPVAVFWGIVPATLVSVASMLAFNWFFLPPTHTLQLSDGANWLALAVYLVTAIVVSALAASARRRAELAELREREAAALPGKCSRPRRSGEATPSRRRCCTPCRTICARHSRRSLQRPPCSPILTSCSRDGDRAELVDTIRSEADRLDRIVGNLLDLSRLESGVAAPHPELWPVEELVGRAVEQVGAGAERVVSSRRRRVAGQGRRRSDRACARQPAGQRAQVLAAGHSGPRSCRGAEWCAAPPRRRPGAGCCGGRA